DLLHLRLDALYFLEPQLVNLARRQLGGRVPLDQQRIILRTVRKLAQGRARAGLGRILLGKERIQLSPGRQEALAVGSLGLRTQASLVRLDDARGKAPERGQQRRIRRGGLHLRSHLLGGQLGDHARLRQSHPDGLGEQREVLIDVRRQRAQARENVL